MKFVQFGRRGRTAQIVACNSDAVEGIGMAQSLHRPLEQAVPVCGGEFGDSAFERKHPDCQMLRIGF